MDLVVAHLPHDHPRRRSPDTVDTGAGNRGFSTLGASARTSDVSVSVRRMGGGVTGDAAGAVCTGSLFALAMGRRLSCAVRETARAGASLPFDRR